MTHRVGFVVFDGVTLLDVSGPAEVLQQASLLDHPCEMARVAAVSTRHLTRLFHTELGTTPALWVERVRLDHAQQLLIDGYGVTSAARHSGFGSDETLRCVFVRPLGITPTAYRERFTTTGTSRVVLPELEDEVEGR